MEQLALITKHKNKIMNTLIIVTALLIIFSIYKRQVKSIEGLKSRKDMELKKNEAFLNIKSLQERIGLYKKNLSPKDRSFIINTLTVIAKDSNARIISLKPVAEENYPFYIKYPFNLIIGVDSYHTLGKFISNIENFPKELFFIDRAQIKRRYRLGESDEKSKLIIDLVISTAEFKG